MASESCECLWTDRKYFFKIDKERETDGFTEFYDLFLSDLEYELGTDTDVKYLIAPQVIYNFNDETN